MIRPSLLALAALAVAAPLAAQSRGAANASAPRPAATTCTRIDTTAAWYRTQAAWWALDTKHDWTDDTLRTMLIAAAKGLEPSTHTAFPLQLGVMLTPAPMAASGGDAAAVAKAQGMLKDMIAKKTWPLRSVVGAAGERAAWLLASGDSGIAGAGMHRMMEAGPGESSPADVAVMEDWMRAQRGRKPIYASLAHLVKNPQGKEVLAPVPSEDLAHVDMRREGAGLPPLQLALCLANRKP